MQAVVRVVAQWKGLHGTQPCQFISAERVTGPVIVDTAIDERVARSDIGAACQTNVVAAEQHAVARQHQIGLDDVGTLIEAQLVPRQGVLGQRSAGAAVRDDARHPDFGAGLPQGHSASR